MRYGVATGIRIYLDSGDTVKFILIAIAAVLLEVYLAYREKRWPGLILPNASVLWAAAVLLICFGGILSPIHL